MGICAANLHYLKPGKRVVLKSFNGSLIAAENTAASGNYWQLIGSKAVVRRAPGNNPERVLITFDCDLQSLGLICHNQPPNSLWVLSGDLKFICRY